MILGQERYQPPPAPVQTALDDAITRIVEMNDGIKDTALTIAVLAEVGYQIESLDPKYAAVMVSQSIHRLIHAGMLVAIDCETPKGGFTFVLPAKSRPSIALPVFVIDNRTRH